MFQCHSALTKVEEGGIVAYAFSLAFWNMLKYSELL